MLLVDIDVYIDLLHDLERIVGKKLHLEVLVKKDCQKKTLKINYDTNDKFVEFE